MVSIQVACGGLYSGSCVVKKRERRDWIVGGGGRKRTPHGAFLYLYLFVYQDHRCPLASSCEQTRNWRLPIQCKKGNQENNKMLFFYRRLPIPQNARLSTSRPRFCHIPVTFHRVLRCYNVTISYAITRVSLPLDVFLGASANVPPYTTHFYLPTILRGLESLNEVVVSREALYTTVRIISLH